MYLGARLGHTDAQDTFPRTADQSASVTLLAPFFLFLSGGVWSTFPRAGAARGDLSFYPLSVPISSISPPPFFPWRVPYD